MTDANGRTVKVGDRVAYATWAHKKPFLQIGYVKRQAAWGMLAVKSVKSKRSRVVGRMPKDVVVIDGAGPRVG